MCVRLRCWERREEHIPVFLTDREGVWFLFSFVEIETYFVAHGNLKSMVTLPSAGITDVYYHIWQGIHEFENLTRAQMFPDQGKRDSLWLVLELGDLIVWEQRPDSRQTPSRQALPLSGHPTGPPPFRSRPKQNALGALWNILTILGMREATLEK